MRSALVLLLNGVCIQLKGGDSLLYHAFKVYKLAPELRWTAGGYIWAPDQTVDLNIDGGSSPITTRPRQGIPPMRGAFSTQRGYDDDGEEGEDIRVKVQRSGAMSLTEAEVEILEMTPPGPVTKEKVPFVSEHGEIEKLVVNALMVVYVP